MTDEEVAVLLDSDEPLILVEAPAGCGKTYQGACYARRAASRLASGRVLILTHTHAACAAFARETRTAQRHVEIKTIDSLIVQIATAYHRSLCLPSDPAAWARRTSDGYSELASRVAQLIRSFRPIAEALANRYPIVIADEHQDASGEQHAIVLALRNVGSKLRLFGDPMQGIYTRDSGTDEMRQRWESIKSTALCAELRTPHRWLDGSPALGEWVLRARDTLREGGSIDLTGALPYGLAIRYADNAATGRGFRLESSDRRAIDATMRTSEQMLVMTAQNETAKALVAFWNREIPLWEGHTRPALDQFAAKIGANIGNAVEISRAVVDFLGEVAVGFRRSSDGERLLREASERCTRPSRGRPKYIQQLARLILEEPNHIGASKCLAELARMRRMREGGMDAVRVDQRSEYWDAVRLGNFADLDQGLSEVTRRRSFSHPVPPHKAISTIHKAKGLQCENAMVIPCDNRFSSTQYSRCRLYVAISRPKRSLTLVLSRSSPSPLFSQAASSGGDRAAGVVVK